MKNSPFLFQSTLPRRERRERKDICWRSPGNFNPHSHEGSDKLQWSKADLQNLFQSTLPRRERLKQKIRELEESKFQSTLPRRERQLLPMFDDISDDISIHTPTKGATHTHFIVNSVNYEFQSTLPRRERQKRLVKSGITS